MRANVIWAARSAILAGSLVLLAILFEQIGPEAIGALARAIGWNFPMVVVLFGCEECLRALALSALCAWSTRSS